MVTYKNKKNKGNYLTANSTKGKKVLKYMHKMCEKSLDYCQKQELTTLEDFAEALESISEEDNPKLKIDVTVNSGGIGMKMAKQPELGSTTGRYMMQHLGFEEEAQGKFTRTGIESILNPEPETSLDEDLDLLDDEENENEIDDLLDEDEENLDNLLNSVDEPKSTSNKRGMNSFSNTTPTGKSGINYDSILDHAAGISGAAATQGHEINGINLTGINAQSAILAAIVGKKAAQKIMAAAESSGKEKELNAIAQRIKAAQERTDELTERGETLTELFEQNLDIPESETEPESDSSPTELLASAVNHLDEKINRTGLSEKTGPKKSFHIDKTASFDEQLQQIQSALDRVEQRLDRLEERIEALEEALKKETEKPSLDSPDSVESLSETTQATLYFDGGSRRNPGIAAGAAVIILPNGETQTTAKFIDQGTNNQAEYTGLIVGLKKAKALGCTDLEIHGDSRLVIDQLTGKKQVRSPHLKPLYQEAQELLSEFNSAELSWVKRDDNTLADQAVNQCLDEVLEKQERSEINNNQPPSSDSTQKCANILLNIYQFEEELATNAGKSVNDGIMLGDNAILYASNHSDSTTISIEKLDGEELFAAVRQTQQNEWEILTDSLQKEDKAEIQRLEHLPTEIHSKQSQKQSNHSGVEL